MICLNPDKWEQVTLRTLQMTKFASKVLLDKAGESTVCQPVQLAL